MSTMIIVAKLRATSAGAADKVEEHLKEIRAAALKEPGCKQYYSTRGNEGKDPLQFFTFEEYENHAAMKSHMESGPIAKLVAAADELIEGGGAGLELAFLHHI